MDDRYVSNQKTISIEENKLLLASKIAVVGCGGLGGYIIELLARIGLGHITAIDGDDFDIKNLNRQILCHEGAIGKAKVTLAKERVDMVNSNINLLGIKEYIDEKNAERILKGHDLVMDALDNIDTRLVLEKTCEKLRIPLVHGAIAGWFGQVSTILPGDNSLSKIYGDKRGKGIDEKLGNPSFTPALVASIQVSQAIKLLLNKEGILSKKMLYIDLLNNEFISLDI